MVKIPNRRNRSNTLPSGPIIGKAHGFKGIIPGTLITKRQGRSAPPGIVLLASGIASGAALDIVLTTYTQYRGIQIKLTNFQPNADGDQLWMRFSTNAGVSFDAGASDYGFDTLENNTSVISTGNTKIVLAGGTTGIGNVGSFRGCSSEINIPGQQATTFYPRSYFHSSFVNSVGNIISCRGAGGRLAAQDTDAVRFLFSTGNIAVGGYAVYGLV